MAEEKKTTKKEHFYGAVGRRKSAVATVRLTKGKGVIRINELPAEEYLNNKTLLDTVGKPLALVGHNKDWMQILRCLVVENGVKLMRSA